MKKTQLRVLPKIQNLLFSTLILKKENLSLGFFSRCIFTKQKYDIKRVNKNQNSRNDTQKKYGIGNFYIYNEYSVSFFNRETPCKGF